MVDQDSWTQLLCDFIKVSQGLTLSLEQIVTRFEQSTGHIAEEKDLAAIASQFAGLSIRAEMLALGDPPFQGTSIGAPLEVGG